MLVNCVIASTASGVLKKKYHTTITVISIITTMAIDQEEISHNISSISSNKSSIFCFPLYLLLIIISSGGRDRTYDLLINSQALLPAELHRSKFIFEAT